MDKVTEAGGEAAGFEAYVDRLAKALGHADRVAPMHAYCTGLLLPGGRKSVEPMAARLAPARVSAAHQSLLHFVGQAPWDDAALLRAVRAAVLPAMGAIEAWIVDDTGFPKKGRHSVGVARQYCGELGKQDNCQVAVSLSLANAAASLPIAWRLYLPAAWAGDAERRLIAGVPAAVRFQTKPEIALEQIRQAAAEGVPPGVVLADAAYGNDSEFREGLTALGLAYAVGILSSTTVWAPGTAPVPPPAWSGRGRPPKRWRRDDQHRPVAVKALAQALPPEAWRQVAWRDGSAEPLASRFAAVRVRPAHGDAPRAEEWLLVEWPEGEAEPTKYWLSAVPADLAIERLVYLAKLRWRIERDYRELKQEVGLGHYEGRGWRGFHHHASLCIAAYGFLVAERGAIPPSGPGAARFRERPVVPDRSRPRGATAAARAARCHLDRDAARPLGAGAGSETAPMPVLPPTRRPQLDNRRAFVTQ
jgi:SRSO17 transposase